MKNKSKELDVDFIGGQKQITKEEELVISEFIRAGKEKRRLQSLRNTKPKTLWKDKLPASAAVICNDLITTLKSK